MARTRPILSLACAALMLCAVKAPPRAAVIRFREGCVFFVVCVCVDLLNWKVFVSFFFFFRIGWLYMRFWDSNKPSGYPEYGSMTPCTNGVGKLYWGLSSDNEKLDGGFNYLTILYVQPYLGKLMLQFDNILTIVWAGSTTN